MNGLEAIRLMEQGKIITDGREFWKIENEEIVKSNKRMKDWFGIYKFLMEGEYEEYIEPKRLTGWERVEKDRPYYGISYVGEIFNFTEIRHYVDKKRFDNLNYFSTKEKAEEINFKQTLFRKLQRFSDENGGNEIDWNDPNQRKWSIKFDRKIKDLYIGASNCIQNFGQVYFISEKVAKNAIELFHDELIKYFTM